MTKPHNPVDDLPVVYAPQHAPEPEGMADILAAFIRNPRAAFELVVMIVGGAGLYYGMTQKIDGVAAASETHWKETTAQSDQHYKDLSVEMARNNEKVLGKMAGVTNSNAAELQDIKNLFQRGDTRWTTVQDRLNAIEVRFTKLEDKLDYVTRVIDRGDRPKAQDRQ